MVSNATYHHVISQPGSYYLSDNLDVATANGIADTVTVLFNDGTGGYGGLNSYGGVDGAYAVTCCDVDGDTDADVLSANLVSDDLAVFLNNGNGTLGAPSFYPVGSNPSSVKSADIIGDSATDLVVAFADGVRVFANDCAVNCGDGVCEDNEDVINCPKDCPINVDSTITCLFTDIRCVYSEPWCKVAGLYMLIVLVIYFLAKYLYKRKRGG